MAYFQGKVAFRQLIFGGYLVAITRILGYNTHRWMLIVYLELFTLKFMYSRGKTIESKEKRGKCRRKQRKFSEINSI